MRKHQKEILKSTLDDEKKELNHLKAIYKKTLQDISGNIKLYNDKIEILLADIDEADEYQKSVLRSQIYHRDFQANLQKQLNAFLSDLNNEQYKSINDYIEHSYEGGYIATMYDIAQQGIPIIAPIDQKKVIKAMSIDSKISKTLYEKLGEDVNVLKKRIANNISRGIASADSYQNIARNIANDSNVGFNKAMRIARTEGHRVHQQAAFDAQHVAKDKGADVVKQWNSVLDGRVRTTHRKLDGQLREVEEPFEMDGKKAMHPSGFGRPEEDINCRCVMMQRAKWALDDDELETLKERAAYHDLDKAEDFEDFRKKYLKVAEKVQEQQEQIVVDTTKFVPAKTIEEAQEYAKQFCNNGFMATTFKGEINYKGIHLDNANAINKALTDVFNSVELEKISGIKVVSPTSAAGKKAFKDGADAVFSYSPIEHGIFINKDILKNKKAFDEYVKKSEDAWEMVMNNIDKLSGGQKELALLYKKAGRSLVDGKTIEGMFTHELGHHVQWTLLDAKTNNALGANMSKYAPKISGYANASKGEYFAESFAAYMKGETDILDPEFVAAMKAKAKIIKNPVKTTKLNNIDEVNKKGDELVRSIYEKHRIRNSLNLVPLDELEGDWKWMMNVDYGKMSAESADIFNSTFAKLANKYDTSLQEIRPMEVHEFFANKDAFAFVYHDYSMDKSVFAFNSKKVKDIEKLSERIGELSTERYCIRVKKGYEAQYVATHEFAHTLINMEQKLSEKTNFVKADYKEIKKARKEINALYDKYVADVGKAESLMKDYENKIFDLMLEGEDDPEIEKLFNEAFDAYDKLKISDYSLVNADEFMAECFTDVQIGENPSEYSRKLVEILDKYYGVSE